MNRHPLPTPLPEGEGGPEDRVRGKGTIACSAASSALATTDHPQNTSPLPEGEGVQPGSNPAFRWAGFTLVEVMVVVGVVGLLTALLLPALAGGRAAAARIQCVGNLHQLGLAGQLYWDDHEGRPFDYRGPATNGGDLYWFGWLERGAEGQRAFDRTQGALHPYLAADPVALCPSLAYALRDFKRKATGAAFGYGYNLHLAPRPALPSPRVTALARPAETVFLADAAQVNTFQWPASAENPMLEEFYYVNATERTAHFRHRHRLNAVFVDGHVATEKAVLGSWDERLPRHHVGRLRPEILRVDEP